MPLNMRCPARSEGEAVVLTWGTSVSVEAAAPSHTASRRSNSSSVFHLRRHAPGAIRPANGQLHPPSLLKDLLQGVEVFRVWVAVAGVGSPHRRFCPTRIALVRKRIGKIRHVSESEN